VQQELHKVVAATHSHSQLHRKLDFMLELLDHVDRTHMVEIPACLEMLQRVAALNGNCPDGFVFCGLGAFSALIGLPISTSGGWVDAQD
jgi:hypothetical protein